MNKDAYSSHVWVNLDTVVAEIRIVMPFQHANTMFDSLNTLTGAGDSKLDHSGSLE
jgi:hypothetical protein